jgi:hypothetical protein
VIWGPTKCGKSFWVFDLMLHVALGWDYRGMKVRQGTVVYLHWRVRRDSTIGPKRSGAGSGWALGTCSPALDPTPMTLVADHKALIASIKIALGGEKRQQSCSTLSIGRWADRKAVTRTCLPM